jgi:hypothetical protein
MPKQDYALARFYVWLAAVIVGILIGHVILALLFS